MNQEILIGLAALLPVTALVTVIQKRPFFALISRGMMGAVAALLYAVLGAPDVALTEALMGTLLTILLYVIAVRSSMVVKVGWLAELEESTDPSASGCDPLFEPVRRCCRHHHLETEFIRFTDPSDLETALHRGRIQAVFEPAASARNMDEPIPSGPYTLRLSPEAPSLFRLFQEYFRGREIRVFRTSPRGDTSE